MMRGITGSTTGSTTGSRELPVVPGRSGALRSSRATGRPAAWCHCHVVSVGPRVTQAQRRARTPRGYYVVLSHATRALYCCVPTVAFSALGSRHVPS